MCRKISKMIIKMEHMCVKKSGNISPGVVLVGNKLYIRFYAERLFKFFIGGFNF